jgi:tetratricopeptide (TPR) repeat protein
MVISGGERSVRSALLDAIGSEADAEGIDTVVLRAHPHDHEIPYGVLYPWLAKWHHPKFTLPLAGLIVSLRAESADRGEKRAKRQQPAVTDVTLPPAEMRAELLDLVEGRTQQSPAVITIEDGEFMDMPSRDWLCFLAPRLAELPLLIAISLPPDERLFNEWQKTLADSPVIWHRVRHAGPSGGNRDGLSRRLGMLNESTLNALAAVVVAGPDASRTLLQEVVGATEAELTRSLYPAVQAGLVSVDGDGYVVLEPDLIPNLGGLVKETALRSLHRVVVRTILEHEPRPHGALLFRVAAHWAEAREVYLGVPALTAASMEAERWGSLKLAEYWMKRAIRLSEIDPTTRGRELEEQAYARLAIVNRLNLNHPAANKAYKRALEMFKERNAKGYEWVRYVVGLSYTEWVLGKDPRGVIESALSQVHGHNSDMEALLLRTLSQYLTDNGQTEEAQAAAERACELADKENDVPLKVRTHVTAAASYIFSPSNPESAKAHLLKVLEQRGALAGTAEEELLVEANNMLMVMEYSLGNYLDAVVHGEAALAEARLRRNPTTLFGVTGNLAEVCIQANDLPRAKVLAKEMHDLCQRLSLEETNVNMLAVLQLDGLIAACEGRKGDARTSLERCVRLAEKGGHSMNVAQALTHLASLGAKDGDREAAYKYVRLLELKGLRRTLMWYHQRLLDSVEKFLSTGEGTKK